MNKESYNSDVYLKERQLIQAAANKNQLVVFVGAGTSIPCGMPSWSKAIEKIREHLSDKDGDDDFLRIPQYYYNEHGKNNYVKLMREIFKYGKNLYSGSIHHKILKFRTKYIITTNYDHLLEQALSEENQVFDVVSHDKDLAYGTADRKIIKMHGDFEHDNFVLKEDDYLRYSYSFRLIETYIKALIAGNVILFLGYSFSDPDLKQIFTWVKEILGSDRPQSYIVEVGENYSAAKTNYFKNFGINILYASKKLKDFKPDELEKNLEKMVDFLQSESESEDKIDILYQRLKPFINMNYVHSEYIKTAFEKCGVRVDFNAQTLMAYQMEENKQDATNDLLHDICLSLNDANKIPDLKKREKLSEIINVLGKSRCHEFSIKWIHSEEKSIAIDLPSSRDSEMEKICTTIIKYDINTLRKLREDNFGCLSDSKPQFYFQQAFLSYLLGDYIDTYQNLQKATVSCYRNEMHDCYFLAMLNRILLSKTFYKYDLDRSEIDTIKKIRKDAEGLDLEQAFQTLPKSERKCNDYLKDLYTFQIFYRSFQEVYKKSLKVKEEANTSYWIHSSIPQFRALGMQIKDLWYYITSNFLLFDSYEECINIFELYGRIILESILAPDIEGDNRFGFMNRVTNIRPETLENFDLYIITRYVPLKDIESIVLKSKRRFIPFDAKGKKYLETIIPNIPKLISLDRLMYGELFWEIIYVISHLEYDKNLISSIVAELKNYVDLHDVAINWNRIAILFQSVINQKRDFTEDDNELSNTLFDFLVFVTERFESITSDGNRVKQNVQNVLYTGIRLHNKIQKKDFSSKGLSHILRAEYIETLAIIYPLLDEDYKKEIKKISRNRKWEVDDNNFYDIYLLVQNKVIISDEELEKSILNYLHGLEDDRKTTFPGKYERALQYVTNLYTGDLLKNKSEFEAFIHQSGDDFWKFVIAPQNFDSDSFKLEWLKYLSRGFLDKLSSNESFVKNIRCKVTKEYLDGCLDDIIMNTYFEFFSCDKIS